MFWLRQLISMPNTKSNSTKFYQVRVNHKNNFHILQTVSPLKLSKLYGMKIFLLLMHIFSITSKHVFFVNLLKR